MATPTPAPRILVVDDEDSIRSLAERILREADYDVTTAASGREALQLVDAQPAFDLFVLDAKMPEMAGDELARQLRQREPDAKVLYRDTIDRFVAFVAPGMERRHYERSRDGSGCHRHSARL